MSFIPNYGWIDPQGKLHLVDADKEGSHQAWAANHGDIVGLKNVSPNNALGTGWYEYLKQAKAIMDRLFASGWIRQAGKNWYEIEQIDKLDFIKAYVRQHYPNYPRVDVDIRRPNGGIQRTVQLEIDESQRYNPYSDGGKKRLEAVGWISPENTFFPLQPGTPSHPDFIHQNWDSILDRLGFEKNGRDRDNDFNEIEELMFQAGWVRQAAPDLYEASIDRVPFIRQLVLDNFYPKYKDIGIDVHTPSGDVKYTKIHLDESVRSTASRLFLEMGFGKKMPQELADEADDVLYALAQSYRDRYPGIRLDAHVIPSTSEIYLDLIDVHPRDRNKGIGSAFMKDLAAIAKKYGLSISLDPVPEKRKKAALHRFYRRAGFGSKSNRRFYDPTARGSWIRPEEK